MCEMNGCQTLRMSGALMISSPESGAWSCLRLRRGGGGGCRGENRNKRVREFCGCLSNIQHQL